MTKNEILFNRAISRIAQSRKHGTDSINLAGLQLTKLPEGFTDLTHLKKVDLSNNKLSVFPNELLDLTEISKLNLSGNHLTELPSSIGLLNKLKEFFLRNNAIKELPKEICHCTNLHTLALSGNKLEKLPKEFSLLSQLSNLFLGNNRFRYFPVPLRFLINLRSLGISRNQIEDIPDWISDFINLKALLIYDNLLSSLPREVGGLKSLKVLDVRNNYLEKLPHEVCKLINLKKLDVRNNSLVKLPESLNDLIYLEELLLQNNKLRELPSLFGHLTNLQNLNLHNNKLSDLPTTFGNLENLKELNLSTNLIVDIPNAIFKLKQLKVLTLSHNRVKVIPIAIEQLISLNTLSLYGNLIENLPQEIGNLSKLERLTIEDNQIQRLPIEITKLTNLKSLLLHGNKFRLPAEIIGPNANQWSENQNAQKIIQYLRSLEKGSLSRLSEVKLIVLGQGGVGKTSIVNRLAYNKFDQNSERTTGINIQKIYVETPDREVTVSTWDFGGQEIMHSTHEFFLTSRSIYMVVLDARIDRQANRPHYWLNLIEQSGGEDSPIIIVINKIDENPILSLNENELRRKHNIASVIKTSCLTGEGLESLQSILPKMLLKLRHLNDDFPTSWLRVKDALEVEKSRLDVIDLFRFKQICEQNKVGSDAQQSLLELLHDLGTVFNFYSEGAHEILDEAHILNPEWVTEGVYSILNSEEIYEGKGVLEKYKLRNILDKQKYPNYMSREYILGMMREFELAYPFSGGDLYLIPDLLPDVEPTLESDVGALKFEYRYRNFLPASIISRFIVKQHSKIRDHTTELWRNGLVVHFDEMRGLIRSEEAYNKITIAVHGPHNRRRELLAIIRDTFDSIHSSFAKLPVKAMVPIPDEEWVAVSYKALLAAEREGRTDIYVEDLDEYIDVRPLLEGVDGAISNRRLFTTLRERFSIDEIRDALFEVGVDHEKVLGEIKGRPAFAREAVSYLERRGMIEPFVAKIRKSRPDIDL